MKSEDKVGPGFAPMGPAGGGVQRANCPVCSTAGVSSGLACKTAFGYPQYFLKCPNCETLFDQAPVSVQYEEGYYTQNSYLKLYLEKAASLRLFSHLILSAWRALQLVRLKHPRRSDKGRLVEVGCGPGLLLDIARFHGWEPRGIELNKEASAWAREKLELSVQQENLFEQSGTEKADLLVASEVIEHFDDPQQFVGALQRLLRPDGVLLLTTPNAKSSALEQRGESWVYLGNGYHTVLYSPKSLEMALRNSGFKTVQISTFEGDERLLAVAFLDEVPAALLGAMRTPFEQDEEADRLCQQYLWNVRSRREKVKDSFWQGCCYRLVEMLLMAGQNEQALKIADELQAFLNSTGCTLNFIHSVLEEASETKNRNLFYDQVPTFAPNLHFLIGLGLLQTGRAAEAAEEFRLAHGIAEKLERLPSQVFEELTGITPSMTYLFHLGFALVKADRMAEAKPVFEHLKSHPLSPGLKAQTLLNEAVVLTQLGQFQAATDALTEIKGMARDEKGHPELAEQVSRRGFEIEIADLRNQREGLASKLRDAGSQINDLQGQLQAEQAIRRALEAQLQYIRYRIADKLNAFAKRIPLAHRAGKSLTLALGVTWKRLKKKKKHVTRPTIDEPLAPESAHIPLSAPPRQKAELAGCTIIAKNYLAAARVLTDSFKKHNPESPFFVLIVDWVDGHFKPVDENFLAVEADQLKLPRSDELFFKYNVLEASTAVKPYFLEHLFREHDLQKIVYLDPDILVAGGFSKLTTLLEQDPIVLTPHLTSPIRDDFRPSEFQILQSGTYNLGFIALRRSEIVDRFLLWWQAKLQDKCFMAPEFGMHVDQKWVDLVPGLFGASILREPGYNVAYWNLHERHVTVAEGEIKVNQKPAYFFHFSGFDPNNMVSVSKHQDRFTIEGIGDAKVLFEAYKKALLNAGWSSNKNWTYGRDYFRNGVRIPEAARRLYGSLGDKVAAFGNPFVTSGSSSFFAWLNESVDGETDPSRTVTRLWYEILQQRSDLRGAYPNVLGNDRDGFLEWIRNSGRRECRIHSSFLPAESEERGDAEVPTSNTAEPAIFGVNLVGYANSEKGMGEAVRADLRALRATEIPVVITNIADVWGSKNVEQVSPELVSETAPYAVNLFHINADQVAELLRTHGNRLRGRYNIAYWTWELASFPQQWSRAFQPFDEIWVPSTFVRDAVLRTSPVPVTVVPHCLNLDSKVSPGWTRERLGINPQAFVFLFFFDFYSYAERKNPLGLIRAFQQAFGQSDDVQLVIKCSHKEFDTVAFESLRQAARGRNILLYDAVLPREEVNALLRTCNCYVSLHRSEGFGLTLSEAMMMAKPVIATAYSGNLDFMTPQNSFLVNNKLVRLDQNYGPYGKGEYWAEPDLKHAAELMRLVFEDRASAARVAGQGQQDVLAQLSPSAVGRTMHERLTAVMASRPAPQHAGINGRKDMSSYLSNLESNWDRFGKTDPLYWILTLPGKKGNRWNPKEFFDTGKKEIEQVLSEVKELGIELRHARALDFGCGVGRLTQALAENFDETHGVDISPSMVERANRENRFGSKCIYHRNSNPDLKLFPDEHFDFIYSNVVLQHMHPSCSKEYLAEFVRVLRPGGVAVFQLPSELVNPMHRREYEHIVNQGPKGAASIEMYGVPRDEVCQVIKRAGATVTHVEPDRWAGEEWFSFRYFVAKTQETPAKPDMQSSLRLA